MLASNVRASVPLVFAASDFADALQNARDSIYLSLYEDETASHCTWFVPQAHVLESWGDARSQDGTVSLVQPLIEPLFNGVTDAPALNDSLPGFQR